MRIVDDSSFGSFDNASRAVLKHLHEVLGFDLLMVTRSEGNDWIVLQAADQSYGVQPGNVFAWTDTFCSRMVQGQGPRIAPRSDSISVYASAPIARQVPIGAYVGVPLSWHDGRLFGTLCGIHPTPRPKWITDKLQLVELFARLLSSILQAEIKADQQTRRAERARMEAMTDALTGLYNRRGWQRLVSAEEARCHRYGHPASLISIDIDNLKKVNDSLGHSAGDELIQRTAAAVTATLRRQDVPARIGGDEFAIMAVECDSRHASELVTRLEQELICREVDASLGHAMCQPGTPFAETWEVADQAMYVTKERRRSPTGQLTMES